MDDPVVFGPVAYRLTLSDAIDLGLLADYQILVPVVDNGRGPVFRGSLRGSDSILDDDQWIEWRGGPRTRGVPPELFSIAGAVACGGVVGLVGAPRP